MKKSILLSILVMNLIISCGIEESDNIKTTKEIAIPEEDNKVVISLETDNRFAFIKQVFQFNNDLYIKVDYVNYLTGIDALNAEKRDKAYFVDGNDTITNITDGYYISNINPKIRTFKIEKGAITENVIDDSGSHKLNQSKELNQKQLETYLNLNSLLFIHIENGIVKSIDERFMP